MDNKAFEIAAKWWADQLRYDFKNNTGEFNIDSQMDLINCTTSGFSEAQIMSFQKNLEKIISQKYAEHLEHCKKMTEEGFNGEGCHMGFGVDYHPSIYLVNAAETAGINVEYKLPGKTHMWLETNPLRVLTRPSYQIPERYIYPVEK